MRLNSGESGGLLRNDDGCVLGGCGPSSAEFLAADWAGAMPKHFFYMMDASGGVKL
jgi:hypothetical protein